LVVFAWQYPFFLFGLAFPISIVVAFLLDEPTDAGTDADSVHDRKADAEYSLCSLLARPSVAAILVGRSVPPFVYVGFLTINSFLIVKVLDGSPQVAGILVALVSLVYALAGSHAGRITTRSGAEPAHWPLRTSVWESAWLSSRWLPTFSSRCSELPCSVWASVPTSRCIVVSLRVGPTVIRGSLVSVSTSLSKVATTISPIVVGSLIRLFETLMRFASTVRTVILRVGVVGGAAGLICVAVAGSGQLRSSFVK
jgi:hypothetical protein